jgi:Ca2+-binding EF-hand superfamily protein
LRYSDAHCFTHRRHSFCEKCIQNFHNETAKEYGDLSLKCPHCPKTDQRQSYFPDPTLDHLCSRYAWWQIPVKGLKKMHETTKLETKQLMQDKLTSAEKALVRKKEFLMERVVSSIKAKLPKMKKAEDFFAEFDTDGGGTIDYQELRDGLLRLEIKLNDSEFNELVQFWDHDLSGEIDYVEFVHSFKIALDRF